MATQAAHSQIGASSMYRWSRCPGSVKLSKDIPSTTSSYAEEGTRAHEIAAEWLTARLGGKKIPASVSKAPAEMIEAVKTYVDFIEELTDEPGAKVLIEHRFDLSSLHPGLFGTADAVIYRASNRILQVVDYKHGAGVPVEVWNNPQLLYYALGGLLSTGHPCETVEITIVQPRCYHQDGPIRTQAIDAIELLDFAADLVEYAKATEAPKAPLTSGDHCHFCPAKGVCPELEKQALATAQMEFRSDLSYDPAKLALALDNVPAIEAWLKGVREFAYQEALQGRVVPGYKLVQKRTTRRWRDPSATLEFLEQQANDSQFVTENFVTEPELKSPAQIEKVLGAKGKHLLEGHIVSESSGLSLVPESDSRPPAKLDAAAEFALLDSTT